MDMDHNDIERGLKVETNISYRVIQYPGEYEKKNLRPKKRGSKVKRKLFFVVP